MIDLFGLHIYSLEHKSKEKRKRETMSCASASIQSASANIEERVSALEKVVEWLFSPDPPQEEKPCIIEEKPKKKYVCGWLLFRRDRGPQAKKVLEKLRIVSSGPNLVKVLSAMWAEIGDQGRAEWNEKARAIRCETAF